MSRSSPRPIHIRLPVQMVIILVSLVVVTAAAIGLPSIWLVQQELDKQAQARVAQGGQTAQTSLSAGLTDLSNLAILTAQRPTLNQLIKNGANDDLQAYLQTLQTGAGLDLALVCSGSRVIAIAGASIDTQTICSGEETEWSAVDRSANLGWLLAAQPLADQPLATQLGDYRVVVGQSLDDAYMERLRIESGLDIVLLKDGDYLASSFPQGEQAWEAIRKAQIPNNGVGSFFLGNTHYDVQHLFSGHSGLEILAALSTADIEAAQTRLAQTISVGILLVVLAASGLAYYLALRLSHPLERLRAAAVKLRKGDLVTPVSTRYKVVEIAQVAYALEDARSVLQHTLGALRREKEWSDHLLSSVVEGIVTLDRNRRITFFSQGAERITGWRKELALGKHIDEVLLPAQGDETFSRSLPEPGGRPAVFTVRTRVPAAPAIVATGQTAPVHNVTLAITGARLAPPEAGRVGTALVLRDVSDEEAIRRLLGDFLANITHEFRTPLSALAASIELMLDQLPNLSQSELSELLDSLRLGTLSLQTLIDNLLEGASIEAGRFRVQPRSAELSEVIAEVARTMQPLVEKYGQRLEIDQPTDLPAVRIDPRRTAQVLVNLLSNAIKWSPTGSPISLNVSRMSINDSSDAQPKDFLKVTVTDCGPGIPPEHLADVFTRFSHLQNASGRAEYGAGLGLSVVKAIVEAQGGRVGALNRAEGGAEFWVTVPAVGASTEAGSSTGVPNQAGA